MACLIIIAILMLSIAPGTIFAQAQTLVMVTDEIDALAPLPATSLPDLEVTEVVYAPLNPTSVDTVTITATIKNSGTAASMPTSVNFLDGNNPLGSISIGRLKAGKSVTVTFTIPTTLSNGDHTINVNADPNNKVTESNEGNNGNYVTFTVGIGTPAYDIAITSATLSRLNLVQGESLTATVIVTNQGTYQETTQVTLYSNGVAVDSQPVTLNAKTSQTLTFTYTPPGIGTYNIRVEAAQITGEQDLTDNSMDIGIVTVSEFAYRLTIEIDYMVGHQPTGAVLTYLTNYYAESGIQVVFDTENSNEVPLDTSVSTTDFWAIEKSNDAGPDNANGSPNTGKYTSAYKWVLYGTVVAGSPNTVGYCYTTGTRSDLLAGNYIYIADQSIDDYFSASTTLQTGGEACVLLHEVGHSIGIAILSRTGSEVYCSDSTCIMSYLSTANAQDTNNWHYCNAHWATKNLNYYTIV